MDSSPIDSGDDRTFHLIRLPKVTIERAVSSGNSKVGTVFVYDSGEIEFYDDQSKSSYNLIRNTPIIRNDESGSGSQKLKVKHVIACEESDLLKVSLQEAIHLGKVTPSTLLAVPKDVETSVSTASE